MDPSQGDQPTRESRPMGERPPEHFNNVPVPARFGFSSKRSG